METIQVPKEKFELMIAELATLRESKLYKRLLEFEENMAKGRRFTRTDLGF